MSLSLRIALIAAMAALAGCALTSHPTGPASLGTPRGSAAMLAVIDEPGPVRLETVVSADWAVDRGGLIDLSDPRAKEAHLTDDPEPIQIYFHAIHHPTRGMYIVDTGVERAYKTDPSRAAIRGVVASVMKLERLHVRNALGDFLATQNEPLRGVFFTHLHLDHVSGGPDLPPGTPLFAGPREPDDKALQNLVLAPNIDRALAGQGTIAEWQFEPDPEHRFDGVLDVFGDGSVWALLVPGHTPGSTAFVVRTPEGPVLLTGDVCHTAWGWNHDVVPGTFTSDHKKNAESLARLRQLSREHPKMKVRLGHQPLEAVAGPT